MCLVFFIELIETRYGFSVEVGTINEVPEGDVENNYSGECRVEVRLHGLQSKDSCKEGTSFKLQDPIKILSRYCDSLNGKRTISHFRATKHKTQRKYYVILYIMN